MAISGTDVVVAPVSVNRDNRSYVQWGPIMGGAVIATAISTIMTVFGSAIGLSMVSADFERSSSATALAIGGGLWALWVMASATMAGGYLAGRMRHPSFDANAEERKVRDATHGLLVWATGALLITIVATSSLFVPPRLQPAARPMPVRAWLHWFRRMSIRPPCHSTTLCARTASSRRPSRSATRLRASS